MRSGIRRLFRRAVSGDEKRYRSPREIALRNAADSLGVTLGEDYLADLDLEDIRVDQWGTDDPSRVDAFREELLTYIEAQSNERKRRNRTRALKIGMTGMAVSLAVVLVAEVRHRKPAQPEDDRLALPKYVGSGVGFAKGGMKVVTKMPAVDGGDLVHSTYRDLRENLCLSTAQVIRGTVRNETRGDCVSSSDLVRAISRRPSFFTGGAGGRDHVLVSGYGRSDIERIVADDPEVRVESAISPVWHPGGMLPMTLCSRHSLCVYGLVPVSVSGR